MGMGYCTGGTIWRSILGKISWGDVDGFDDKQKKLGWGGERTGGVTTQIGLYSHVWKQLYLIMRGGLGGKHEVTA